MKETRKAYHQNKIQNKSGNVKGTWKVFNSLMCSKLNTEITKIDRTTSVRTTDSLNIAIFLNTFFTQTGPKRASVATNTSSRSCPGDFFVKGNSKFNLTGVSPASTLN